MLDAHMDEVGLIITSVTTDGFLKFKTVGGIDTAALMFRKVKINSKINGVIGGKPIHLIKGDARKKLPESDNLYIDIGVSSKEQALEKINLGDRAIIESDFILSGENIKAKAIDDRIGCAVLINLLKSESEYDFYASFSVQEEIGTRGAKTAAFAINPDAALVIEATTAADISGVPDDKKVCKLGDGAVVSFMDRGTVYDKDYYNAALQSGVPCQPKKAVAGGNNSAGIHLSRGGVRTLAISLPCRYIHSASCVASIDDCKSVEELTKYMLNGICSGNIK
jgi:endoglucanase